MATSTIKPHPFTIYGDWFRLDSFSSSSLLTSPYQPAPIRSWLHPLSCSPSWRLLPFSLHRSLHPRSILLSLTIPPLCLWSMISHYISPMRTSDTDLWPLTFDAERSLLKRYQSVCMLDCLYIPLPFLSLLSLSSTAILPSHLSFQKNHSILIARLWSLHCFIGLFYTLLLLLKHTMHQNCDIKCLRRDKLMSYIIIVIIIIIIINDNKHTLSLMCCMYVQ